MAVSLVPLTRAVGWFGAANLLATLAGYAVTVILARALSPQDFGATAALLAVGLVGTIPASAVQLAVARQTAGWSTGSGGASAVHGTVLRVSWVLLLTGAVVTVPLSAYLRLDSPLPLLLVTATLPPMVLTSAYQGILLGRTRIGRLAASTATSGASRLVLVGVALAVGGAGGPTRVMAAMLAAAVVTAVVTALLVGRGREARPAVVIGFAELAHGTAALSGLFVLTTIDVPMARHLLDPAAAGAYAFGSVFAKACFWGPQFLAVLAFPRLVSDRRPRRQLALVLAATAGLGVAASVVLAATGVPLVAAVGGRAYDGVGGLVAAFGLLGTSWALVNVAVLWTIAGAGRAVTVVVWTGTAAQLVALQALGDRASLALVLAVVAAVAGAVVLATLVVIRRGGPPPAVPDGVVPAATGTTGLTSPPGVPPGPGASDDRRTASPGP